jgi:hypothetical protein
MSWFRSDSRKERNLSSTVDMPPTMLRPATSRQTGDAAYAVLDAPPPRDRSPRWSGLARPTSRRGQTRTA